MAKKILDYSIFIYAIISFTLTCFFFFIGLNVRPPWWWGRFSVPVFLSIGLLAILVFARIVADLVFKLKEKQNSGDGKIEKDIVNKKRHWTI